VHTIKVYRGADVQLNLFLTSTINAGEWPTAILRPLYVREKLGINQLEDGPAPKTVWTLLRREKSLAPAGI
jgi:hypothetical protein